MGPHKADRLAYEDATKGDVAKLTGDVAKETNDVSTHMATSTPCEFFVPIDVDADKTTEDAP